MATKQLMAMQSPVANREDWETPAHIFDPLHREFRFELDAAASDHNAKTLAYIGEDMDGLVVDWSWAGSVWVNPPYGREIPKWVRKAWEESRKGATVVMLVPARTDTRWFHDYVLPHAEVRFIRGRIRFVGAPFNAPFPSAVVIFRPTGEAIP